MADDATQTVHSMLTASVIQIEREKTMGSSQSLPGCAPKSATSGSEPSAVCEPATHGDRTERVTVRGINGRSRKLKPHKKAKARGLLPGARRVTVWDVEGDDSCAVEFRTGKEVTRLRLSREALDALCELRHPAGVQRWEYVVRIADALAAKALTPSAADTSAGEQQQGSSQSQPSPDAGPNSPRSPQAPMRSEKDQG